MTETKQLTVTETLKRQENEFAALLKASGTDIKKFMNNAIMAVNDKPEIKKGEVTTRSVFAVCSRAANDGVVLDGKEAALVIGWNGRTKQKEAQYRLMAAGVMKQIRRSPDIVFIACQVVHENDVCTIDFVTDGIPVKHEIDLKRGRGEPIGAYVVAKLATGEWTSPEYMSKEEIEAVRDGYSAKDKDGNFSKMWTASPGEAWRKTVLHRAKKRLPISDAKAEEVLRRDEDDDFSISGTFDGDSGASDTDGKRQTRAAKAVKDAVKTAEAPSTAPDIEDITDAEYAEVSANSEDAVGHGEEPPM
jgi:recombination protein RecT